MIAVFWFVDVDFIVRCTSTRRLFLHRRIADSFVDSLAQFYGSASTKQGDPLNPSTLIGPLHTRKAVENYAQAVSILEKTNADFRFGSPQSLRISLSDSLNQGNFVQPTIVIPEPPSKTEESRSIWHTETFAPLLKVAVFDTLEEVIELNNSVPQGLSSTLWTRDIGNIGKWLGPGGSDCGIVNVRFPSLSFLQIWVTLTLRDHRSMLERAVQRLVLHLEETR